MVGLLTGEWWVLNEGRVEGVRRCMMMMNLRQYFFLDKPTSYINGRGKYRVILYLSYQLRLIALACDNNAHKRVTANGLDQLGTCQRRQK